MKEKTQTEFIELFKNIYKYTYFRVKNKEAAEDITSEVIAIILEGKKNIDQIQFYSIGIARNVIADYYRKIKKENKADMVEIENYLDTYKNEDVNLTEELRDFLKEHLELLDSQTAEIITLRAWQGMKFSEIASLMNEKENTVKQKFYRGVEELKGKLNQDGKKQYAFTLPILLGGIKAMFSGDMFSPTQAFTSSINSQLINLQLFLTNMANTSSAGILGSFAAKAVIGTILVAVGAAVGVTGNILFNYNTNNKPSEVVEESNTETNTTKTQVQDNSGFNKIAEVQVDQENIDQVEKEDKCKLITVTRSEFLNASFSYDECLFDIRNMTEEELSPLIGISNVGYKLNLKNKPDNYLEVIIADRPGMSGNLVGFCSADAKLILSKDDSAAQPASISRVGLAEARTAMPGLFLNSERLFYIYGGSTNVIKDTLYYDKIYIADGLCTNNFGVISRTKCEDPECSPMPGGLSSTDMLASIYSSSGSVSTKELEAFDNVVKTFQMDMR